MLRVQFDEKVAYEAGCDEAGRGCLSGPVVAAAVILPPSINIVNLNDSKKLSVRKREELLKIIQEKAVSYAIGVVSEKEIDEINILQASILAMHRALEQLNPQPQLIVVDGNKFKPYANIPHHCIIKGDGKYQNIAAASIVAKTYRDDLMQTYHQEYPQYQWKQNMGYPTAAHRKAIQEFGITPYHRTSFKLIPTQLSLFDD